MKAGLNLYSVKKLLQTEESFIDTLKALKDMGYDYVQYSGSPYDPEKIKRLIKATDMPIVLTHVPVDLILNQTEKLVEETGKKIISDKNANEIRKLNENNSNRCR